MDKKVLVGVGVLAVGGIAVLMISNSGSGPSMPGAGGGGGGAPPETKKDDAILGYEAPIFNINFPEPNFPGIPNIADMFGGSSTPSTKKSYDTSWRKKGFIMNPPTPTGTIREPTRDPHVSNIPAFPTTKKPYYLVDKLM